MNVYCKCGKELEVMGDESGRVSVAPHLCSAAAELAALRALIQRGVDLKIDIVYGDDEFMAWKSDAAAILKAGRA